MSDPDVQHAREALAKLEHLVVQDIFLTETAVLCRRGAAGLGLAGEGRHLHQHQPPGADGPAGACRCRARRARTGGSSRRSRGASGLHWNYTHPREVFAEMATLDAVARQHHLGAARARKLGHLSLRRAGQARATTSSSATASRPRTGAASSCRRDIVPPDELPDAEYPMVLTTGRQLEHWHTGAMTRRAGMLDALEPEAVAKRLARTIARLGVAPGDMVRVVHAPRHDRARGARRTTAFPTAWSSSRSATSRRRPTC